MNWVEWLVWILVAGTGVSTSAWIIRDIARMRREDAQGKRSGWYVWACPECRTQFELGSDGEPIEACEHIGTVLDCDRVPVIEDPRRRKWHAKRPVNRKAKKP